jgi:hypothetical protein
MVAKRFSALRLAKSDLVSTPANPFDFGKKKYLLIESR